MNFTIYILGNKLEKYYTNAIAEYSKRLGRYCKIKWILVNSNADLVKKISPKAYIIYIGPKGESFTSEALATKINYLALDSKSDIAMILSNTPIEQLPPSEFWSISSMDMCAGLWATIVYEQLYRAYRILRNEPYHK